MELEKFLKNNSDAGSLIRILGIGVILLACALILQTCSFQMSKRETVIQPPFGGEPMVVSETTMNSAYARPWAMTVAMLLGNLSVSNVDEYLAMVTRYMQTDLAEAMEVHIRATVQTMRIQGYRLSFVLQDVSGIDRNGYVKVRGELTEIPVIGQPVTKQVTYEVQIRMRGGAPLITDYRGPNWPGLRS